MEDLWNSEEPDGYFDSSTRIRDSHRCNGFEASQPQGPDGGAKR